MPNPHKVIVVDDRVGADVLGGESGLVEVVYPLASIELTVHRILEIAATAESPIVLVDYRLDEPDEIHYRGGGVAAALKDVNPTIPIVLFTSDLNMRTILSSRHTSRSFFDLEIVKEDLASEANSARTLRALLDVAVGFSRLHEMVSGGSVGCTLGELSASGNHDLDSADEWFVREVNQHDVGSLAGWLLHTFLETPSPLLPSWEAAAAVGVTEDSFTQLARAEGFDASYVGLFSDARPRFWRDSLLKLRQGHVEISQVFAAAGASSDDVHLAGCTWCGESVSRGCAICKLGCDSAHALPLSERPGRWGMPTLACFLCIAEGRVAADLLSPDAQDIVEMIKTEEIERPVGATG